MNRNALSKNAQQIQDFLKKHNVLSIVVELSDSTCTSQDAASSIGCNVLQIIKSLVFKDKEANTPLLILVSGSNRVNEQVIENETGKKIVKADATFTREITGFAIGGIPPAGHIHPIQTFIDKDLLLYDTLWAAAGTPHAVFSLSPQDLLSLTSGTIIKVC